MIPRVDAVISIHNQKVEANYHGEALEYLARKLGLYKQAKIMLHLNAIQDIEGELTPDVRVIRDKIYAVVHGEAKKQLDYRYWDLK
jgi:gentisate 1,2-dioxygenase